MSDCVALRFICMGLCLTIYAVCISPAFAEIIFVAHVYLLILVHNVSSQVLYVMIPLIATVARFMFT